MTTFKRGFGLVVCLAMVLAGASIAGAAKSKKKDGATGRSASGAPLNACGCYRENGNCFCQKGGKCECPGECEPVGCEEKRAKEIEREMAAEIKRAQDDEKKRQAKIEADESGTAAPEEPAEEKPVKKTGKKRPAAD